MTMCIQRTLISVLIAGPIVLAAQSGATADVATVPSTQPSELFGLDRDATLLQRLECTHPIPQQIREKIRENLAPSAQDSRAYLESARRDLDGNVPSGELEAPNILELVRIPLDRTVRHPPTPNLGFPVQNEEAAQALDLAGDPLHPRLTYRLPNGLC